MSWQAGSTALVTLALAAGIAWYERSRPPSRLVALVAALAALALAGRVVFAPIPNVQATTDIVLLSGYALGPLPGFVIGAVGALTSNFFLGQGPWTPWQMLGWGMAGVGGGALAAAFGPRLGRWPLAFVCAAAGFAFGAWMDLFTVMSFTAERSVASYMTVAGVSFPFNLAHAIGNAALCLALGPAFVRMLVRFRRRLQVEWASLERIGGAGTAVVALAALVLAGTAGPARAADPSVRFLARAQNADGGFGGARGQPSSQLLTGWAAIGLEAAGRNPLDVRRGGKSPIGYIRAHLGGLNDTGELERTIIALEGAGVDARRVRGRDLVAELLKHRRRDGSFERQSNWTAFGVLALRAAGRSSRSSVVKGSRRLARPPAERRRRVLVRDPGRRQLRRRDRRRAPGPRRRRAAAERERGARARLSAQGPEHRRWLRAVRGLPLQRAVDRLGDRGHRRCGQEPLALRAEGALAARVPRARSALPTAATATRARAPRRPSG